MMDDFMTNFARREYNQWAHKRDKQLNKSAIEPYDRHDATNFSSETLEIRMFKGTLKEKTFFATVEFVDCLINFARDTDMDEFLNERPCVRLLIRHAERNQDKYPHLFPYMEERSIIKHYRYGEAIDTEVVVEVAEPIAVKEAVQATNSPTLGSFRIMSDHQMVRAYNIAVPISQGDE